MIPIEQLPNLLVSNDFTRLQKCLIAMATDVERHWRPTDVRTTITDHGLPAAKKWNISSILSSAGSYTARFPDGYSISLDGRKHIAETVGPVATGIASPVSSQLRQHFGGITDPLTRSFVEESISAFESSLFRSAVVLSWVGAVSVLYEHVTSNHLSAFNAELLKRNSKARSIKTTDDLSLIKEYDFLQICSAISVIGKNVKGELEKCLKLRNGCGHPNSLAIGYHLAAAHIEVLMLTVYSKY